ncbi:MAG: hypothetical protein M5U18_06590 [Dehalococcoidia bacterium]|nr:hypothetical protein [Dehalococcoidia bacterium]
MAREERRLGSGERLGAKPGRVFGVIVGALLIAVLLNAPWLEDGAKKQPFGKERDFWVAVWKPFAAVSRALYLDQPRKWADEALGRESGGDLFELPADADGDATGTPTPGQGGLTGPRPRAPNALPHQLQHPRRQSSWCGRRTRRRRSGCGSAGTRCRRSWAKRWCGRHRRRA